MTTLPTPLAQKTRIDSSPRIYTFIEYLSSDVVKGLFRMLLLLLLLYSCILPNIYPSRTDIGRDKSTKSKVEAEALGSGRYGLVGSHCLSNKVSKTGDKSCTEITPRNHNMRLVDEVDDVLTLLLGLDSTPIGPIPGPPERDTIGLG